jgi:hypothetical protein
MKFQNKNKKLIVGIVLIFVVLIIVIGTGLYLQNANKQAHLKIQPTFTGRQNSLQPNQTTNTDQPAQ